MTLQELNETYGTQFEADEFITVTETVDDSTTRYTLYVRNGNVYSPQGIQEVANGQPCTFDYNATLN